MEQSFTSASKWNNAFLDVDVDVTFRHKEDPSLVLTLPAFWSGKDSEGHDRFTVRFAPTRIGAWTYRISCKQDKWLDGLEGSDGKPEEIQVGPSANPGFLRREGFSWRFSNGAWFYPVGTTAYDWIGTPSSEGRALDYVVEFIKRHFNKVRFSYMSARLEDNAFGGARLLSPWLENGHSWFTELRQVNTRILNLEHWKKLDRIIAKLQQAGVQAELILSRRNPLGRQKQGDWLRGLAGDDLIGDKAIRYFVARYAAFSNVWWCIANEFTESGITPVDANRIGERLKQLDTYGHPLSIHSHSRNQWLFGGQSWPTHGVLQTHVISHGLSGINRDIIEMRRHHGIPFCNDEYGYEEREDTPNTPDTVLRAHWALLLGGGCASYGHSPKGLMGKYMWAGADNFWEVQGKPAPPPRSVADVAAGQEAAPWLRIMRDWMNSGKVGYWRMHPANELAGGEGKDVFCLAAPGSEYLVSGEDGTVRIELSGARGKDLPVEELDPKTGQVRRLGSTKGQASLEHKFSAGQFRILHVGSPESWSLKPDGE